MFPNHPGPCLFLCVCAACGLAVRAVAGLSPEQMGLPGNSVVEPGVEYVFSKYRTQVRLPRTGPRKLQSSVGACMNPPPARVRMLSEQNSYIMP